MFYQQGIKIVGNPITFLVLGLGVYLEKLIVVAYEKCLSLCPPWRSRGDEKVEFTLEQGMKTHREGRGITLLFI